MSVDIAVGGGVIGLSTSAYPSWGFSDAIKNKSVTAADPSNPRKDIVVAYRDLAIVDSSSNNNPNALKFAVVAGTPAGSPSDPSDPTIQSAVGASNPWIKLARILVGAGVTSIVNANITDLRRPIGWMGNLWGGASNTNGHVVPNIADDIVQLLAAVQSPTNKTYTGSTNKMTAGGSSSVLRDSNAIQIDLEQQRTEREFNYVASGCVWSGDSYGSTLAASMTSGVVYIAGRRLTVSAVTSRSFTASKDTYVDLQDNSDGTAHIYYTEASNNAASPALANSGTDANTIRVAIIVAGGSNIANSGSVNQGSPASVLPIASSTPYAVTDSLGDLICPRDPHRKLLGYRQITSDFSTSANSATQVTGLSCPVITPTNTTKKLKITFFCSQVEVDTSGDAAIPGIWDGTVGSGTELNHIAVKAASTTARTPGVVIAIPLVSAGSKTYNASLYNATAARNVTLGATSPTLSFIMVEQE